VSTVTFHVESMRSIHQEMQPLLHDHWNEIALDHHEVPLDPDWHRYFELDDKGSLSVLAARSEGELVGYHIAVISPHLHYKGTLHGITDVYYLKPGFRQGFTGIKMFKAVNEEMKRRGVVKLITGTKLHHDMGRIFERLGYRETERVFTKIVGD
jgi:L-amino acid N-acyltransferase YncA